MEAPNATVRIFPGRTDLGVLNNWLPQLRILMPPQGLVHVGAGNGADLPDYAQWSLNHLVLVEADEQSAKDLTKLAAQHPGWQVQHALVAEAAVRSLFHVASNPRESGLLKADVQRPLWRNLQWCATHAMQAVRLDEILRTGTVADVPSNWLIVDCLPAAAVLRGAGDLINGCDVILARVATLAPEALPEAPGSTLAELAAQLEPHGLDLIAVEEERMPLLARALFVRRPGAGSGALNAALEEARASKKHAEAALAARDEEVSELRQCHVLLEASEQALCAIRDELEIGNAELRLGHAGLESEIQNLLAIQAKSESDIERLSTLHAELQKQLALLEAENRALCVIRDELQMSNEALLLGHARLESEVQNLLISHTKSESDKQRLHTLHAELQEQLAATRHTCAVIEADAESMRSALADRDGLVQDLEAARSDLASIQLARTTEAEAARTEQTSFRATLGQLEERLSDAQAQLGVLESDKSRLLVSGASAAAKLDEIQTELDEMSRQKASMEMLGEERLAQMAGLHADLQGRNDQLENLLSEGENLRQSLGELQGRMASVAAEKGAQETELALTRNHVQYIEGLLGEANAKLHAQLVQAAEQDGLVARLSQQVADQAAELQDWKRQIAGAERARHHFDIEIAKAAAQIALIGEVLVKHDPTTNPDRP